MATNAADLIEALTATSLPVVFDTSTGVRYLPDPEEAPYIHEGFLVIPIVEGEGDEHARRC